MKDQDFRPPAVMLLGTGDGTEFNDALGSFLDGVLVVGYPHADLPETYAPGAAAFLTAYKAKYNRDPSAPQSLEAYAGANVLFDVIAAAGSVDLDKVRAAALAMDKPAHSYANGFGLKFDASQQNTLAIPNIVQWQSGRTVTVYPTEAELPGTTLATCRGKTDPALGRIEDQRFLRGAGRYTADLWRPEMLHAVFVRAGEAQARLIVVPRVMSGRQPPRRHHSGGAGTGVAYRSAR